MKFDCGEEPSEWYARRLKWQRWWAWFPVKVGPHDCRWFEWVERRWWMGETEFITYYMTDLWEYRACAD